MRRIFVVVIFILLWNAYAIAMPIPSIVKSSVAFIYIQIKNDKGGLELVPIGTGFFVGIYNNSTPGVFGYLVTAKHVLKDGPDYFQHVFIRLNKKGGGSGYIPLKLKPSEGDKNVFVHDDPTVDLAVIPFVPDEKQYDFNIIPAELLLTKKDFTDLNIREGSDVFFTGLFVNYRGDEKIFPIVRFGKIALVTNEKIPWKKEQVDLYLVEMTTYGGNSGAPAFFYLGSDREPGGIIVGPPILKIAGVVKGRFNDHESVYMDDKETKLYLPANNGISALVPAYKLYEILYNDELVKQRSLYK